MPAAGAARRTAMATASAAAGAGAAPGDGGEIGRCKVRDGAVAQVGDGGKKNLWAQAAQIEGH